MRDSGFPLPIQFTQKALEAIHRVIQENNLPPKTYLRIGIKGGHCGISGYLLGFDKITDSDILFECGDLPIAMDKRHALHVMGMEIDYVEQEGKRGFVFNNPQAEKIKNPASTNPIEPNEQG